MLIPGHNLGADRPLVVCEIGASHNGDLDTALQLLAVAQETGADAVKLQCYLPSTITLNSGRAEFIISKGPWAGHSLHDLYARAHMPRAWFAPLFGLAAQRNIPLFASVFSVEDLEFMEQFNPVATKIASFELVDTGLITAALTKRRPLILSTGMASKDEIETAMGIVGPERSIWMHCVSSYPTQVEKANLRWMDVLRRNQAYVGLSDHTHGFEVAQMAVARGACVIEKHITLTPGGAGLDDGFASGPAEFADFVQAVHRAHAALGDGDPRKPRDDSEHRALRRSLYVVRDIREGDMITVDNVRSVRPGLGLPPARLPAIMGARAVVDIPAGTPLAEHMIGVEL